MSGPNHKLFQIIFFSLIWIFKDALCEHLRLEPPGTLQAFFTGDSFFVTCFAREDTGATRLTWQGPTGRDITVSRGRVHVEAPYSPSGLQLVLEDVKYRDAGMYACSAVVDGTEIRTGFSLVVHQSIAFWGTPKEQFGAEGKDFTILCNVRSDPNAIVSWYINGSLLINEPKYIVMEEGLYVTQLSRSDAGNYTCRAFVVTPHSSQMRDFHIRLDVHYRPVWVKPDMEPSYGMIGGTVKLFCEAHAQPPPVFEWFRSKALIGNNRIFKIINTKWKSSLQVHIVDPNAFGSYQCVVSNSQGEVNRLINLFEGAFPNPPKLFVQSEKPGSLSVVLTTSVNDVPPSLGSRIHYRKPTDLTWSKTKEHIFNSGEPVIIEDLRFDEDYVLRAKTRNMMGHSNFSEEVFHRTKGLIAETVLGNVGMSSLANLESSSPITNKPLHSLKFIMIAISLCLPRRN